MKAAEGLDRTGLDVGVEESEGIHRAQKMGVKTCTTGIEGPRARGGR